MAFFADLEAKSAEQRTRSNKPDLVRSTPSASSVILAEERIASKTLLPHQLKRHATDRMLAQCG
jgi:hypothetical protein